MKIHFTEGAFLLRGFAAENSDILTAAIQEIISQAPLRHMTVPGGHTMSVAMTNCGVAGWVSDRSGYRYATTDPGSGLPWPPMPECFSDLATRAAEYAGYEKFVPDVCLINRYQPGARMSPHQDKDERNFTAPIVSVSLGAPATFLFGGLKRSDKAQRIPLAHGDVVVWGGAARLAYHGIAPLKTGNERFNLTFRQAFDKAR